MKTLSGKLKHYPVYYFIVYLLVRFDNEYFASLLQQIYRREKLKIFTSTRCLKQFTCRGHLGQVVKKKFKRNLTIFNTFFSIRQTNGQYNDETSVTIGDIVTWWTDLTHQIKGRIYVKDPSQNNCPGCCAKRYCSNTKS